MGSWQQIGNAIHEATVKIGESLSLIGGTGGVEAVKIVIDAIATLIVSLNTDLTEAITAIVAFTKFLTASFAGMGQAMLDVAHGNFAQAWQDMVKGGKDAMDALEQGGQKMASDWTANSKIIADIWSSTADSVDDSSNRIAGSTAAATSAMQLQEQAFRRIATAFAEGKVTAQAYTTALAALNKAQEEAANGLQTASTVLLLVENSYRELGVAVANAATNLKETVAAYDAGQATWNQYVAALDAVDKAQQAVNGGLLELKTAAQLVSVEQEKLLIDAQNAETKFTAVAEAYARGAATAKQYTDALNAMDAAQKNANNGLERFQTAVDAAFNSQQQLATAAKNAQTAMLAQLAVFNQTGEGLVRLLSLMDKYVTSQEAASNGAISWAAANVQITKSEADAELHVANANTLLAQAKQLYADGAISIGVYQKYVEEATKAHEALTGATAKSTDASKAAVPAHNALGASMAGVAENFKVATGAILSQQDALNQVAEHYRQLQINLVNANTELNAVQYAYDHNQASAGMLVGALQNLIKAQEALGGSTNTTTGAMATQINELRNLAGETAPVAQGLLNIGSAATSAAATTVSALNSIGNAINSVAGDAFQATQALDTFFNNMGTAAGASGSATINAKPGDVIGATLNGITSYVTVGSQADLIALHDQAMQRLQDHLKAIQTQTSATVSNTQAVTASTAQSAADAAKIAAGNAAIAAAATSLSSSTDTLATATTAAAAVISSAAGTINDAVKSAADTVVLGSQLLAPLIAAVYAPGTFTASPLTLGNVTNLNNSTSQDGAPGSKTLTGLAPTGSVVMNINVTGNTVTSQSQAQALANTIMATAVSRLRTVAGLKINT
jgi:hypothetical protein